MMLDTRGPPRGQESPGAVDQRGTPTLGGIHDHVAALERCRKPDPGPQVYRERGRPATERPHLVTPIGQRGDDEVAHGSGTTGNSDPHVRMTTWRPAM